MSTALPARRALLLLHADTGGGHRAAAEAVAAAVARRHGDRFHAVLLDPFAEVAPRALGRLVRMYAPLTRRAPWAWGAMWHATDSDTAVRALRATFGPLLEPGLRRAVTAADPAAVVSFHPLLNHSTRRALDTLHAGAAGHRVPLATVVTDLVDVHAAWTCPDVDLLVVPSAGGLDHCRRAGVAADRCTALGLPIGDAFAHTTDRRATRLRLGLAPDRFTVLVTGGGEGAGGMLRRTLALAASGLDIQVAVVCGRNDRLRERLEAVTPVAPTTLTVQGFVGDMADRMAAADVVVTKAGPGTIAEALCAGTPLLLTSYLPGQERGNVGWVVDTGTGRWVPRVRDLLDAVAELSAPDSPALAAMREELAHVARPAAADRIADLLADLAA